VSRSGGDDVALDVRPWLDRVGAAVMLSAAIALVVINAARALDNPDTWFHLRIGADLLQTWTLSDPTSPSRFATEAWAPTQWSVQVLAAWVEGWFGLPGVAWVFGSLGLVVVVTVYWACRARSAASVAAAVTIATLFGVSASVSARPQVVSLALLAVTAAAWRQTTEDLRPRWWLVPLTWVWATAHGFWSVGVLVGIVVCVGIWFDSRSVKSQLIPLVAVPLLSLLAACLTPVGPRLLTSQLVVAERAAFIGEWGPTSFHEMAAVVTALMIGAVVMLWARRGGAPWTDVLMLLLAAALTAYAVRTVSLGAVLVAPILAGAVQRATGEFIKPTRAERVVVPAAAAAAALVLAFLVPSTSSEPGNVPSGLGDELAALPEGSAVMVDDTVGSWIEWRFPHLHPTMDGMFDAYSIDYMRRYRAARDLQPGWKVFLDGTGAEVAVVQRNGAFAFALSDSLGWTQVDADDRWVLMRAPGPG